jgi:hypothetical protein
MQPESSLPCSQEPALTPWTSPSWEANSFCHSRNTQRFMQPESSLPWSQKPALTNSMEALEKLIVTQSLKKYPAFDRNPKVHYRDHKSPPLFRILSQMYSVHTLTARKGLANITFREPNYVSAEPHGAREPHSNHVCDIQMTRRILWEFSRRFISTCTEIHRNRISQLQDDEINGHLFYLRLSFQRLTRLDSLHSEGESCLGQECLYRWA